MADLDVAILFWSQYCNHCNQLFAQLRGHHFDSLEMINVDTDQVKSALLEDDRLLIRYVPTLILYYQDGTVEKYEGDKVTHWFREVIRSIEPPKKRTNKMRGVPADSNPTDGWKRPNPYRRQEPDFPAPPEDGGRNVPRIITDDEEDVPRPAIPQMPSSGGDNDEYESEGSDIDDYTTVPDGESGEIGHEVGTRFRRDDNNQMSGMGAVDASNPARPSPRSEAYSIAASMAEQRDTMRKSEAPRGLIDLD